MKDSDKNRAILAEVIARSWREAGYRQKLVKEPKKILKEAGMDIAPNLEVVLLENTPTVVNAVLPPHSEMKAYAARLDKAVKLLHDLPEGIEVRIRRDTASKTFVVLPTAPAGAVSGELSDAQLEQVAGGKSSTVTETNAQVEAELEGVEVQTGATTSSVVAEVEAAVVPCFIT